MKKFIFLSVFTLFVRLAFGQAPILDSTWLPSPGDKYYIYSLCKLCIVPIGLAADTGANKTWDYDSLYGLGGLPVDSMDYSLPSTRYINCHDTNANISAGDSNSYGCYIKKSTGLYITDAQSYIPGKTSYNYEIKIKPEAYMKTNFHFREDYRDTSGYYYWVKRNFTDTPWHGIRYNYGKYDGYGTLKIGGKTYDTAIRVHLYRLQKDSVYRNLTGTYAKSINFYDEYNWYVPSIHDIALLILTTYSLKPNGSGYDTVGRSDIIRMAIPDTTAGDSVLILKDVPDLRGSTASFNDYGIVINGTHGGNIVYAIFDVEGRQIQSGKPLPNGSVSYHIPASNIRPGVYLLKLQNNIGQTKTIKLIKPE